MKRTPKVRPLEGSDLLLRQISWLLLLILAVVTLVLVTESYDSTILKAPALVVGCGLLAVWVLLRWKDLPTLSLTPVHASMIALLLAGTISMIGAPSWKGSVSALLTLSCLVLLFLFSAEAFRDEKNEALLHIGLLAVALVTGLVGCAQAFLTSPSILFLTSGNQVVMSTLGNTSYYAGFLVLLFPVVLGIGIAGRERHLVGPFSFALLFVMAFLLLKTESRSSWLALFVAVPSFFVFAAHIPRKGWIYAAAAVALLIALGLLFPDVVVRRVSALFDPSGTSSFERRLYFYGGAWRAFLASPIIGNGIGNFVLFLPRFRSPDYWVAKSEDIVPHAHNEYLELLSETGLLGLLAFCAVLFFLCKFARRAFPQLTGPSRYILAGYCAGLVAVLVDNFASMNMRTIPVAAGFWLIAGASMRYLRPPGLPFRPKNPLDSAPIRLVVAIALLAAAPFYVLDVSIRYSAEKIFMQGLMLRFSGKTEAATEKFEETLAANPKHQEAQLYLLSNLIEKEEYARAADLSERLLQMYPYAPKGHLLRAVALASLGEKDQADLEIKRELKIARYPQSYFYAAQFAGSRGRVDEERGYLFALLAECAASGRTDYVREGVERLSEVAAGAGKDSCIGALRTVGAAFPKNGEILTSVIGELAKIGASQEARVLGEKAVADGALPREGLEAILNRPTGAAR